MADLDFTAYQHPVMAVECRDCGAAVGVYCRRPSGHRAAAFHASRGQMADRLFVALHGEDAWIERLEPGDKWRVHSAGRTMALKEQRRNPEQMEMF